MNINIKNILLLICILINIDIYAQNRNIVSGSLADAADGRALEYATVMAMGADGKPAASAVTRPGKGEFALALPAKGTYTLWFRMVGYTPVSVSVTCEGQAVDLGRVDMKAGTERIEGVRVTARQIIRRERDRIVFDVASDPDARRMRMMGIMSKIPELEMSSRNGNLTYRDQPIGKILIDDRRDGMVNERRQYPMEFISAQYMKTVELILPGSPEYDNDEPILVIRLAAPLPFGAAGEIRGSADMRGKSQAGIDAVANTLWVGIGANYSFGYSDSPKLTNATRREMADPQSEYRTTESSSTSWDLGKSHSLGLNLFRKAAHDRIDLQLTLSTDKSDNTSYVRSESETVDARGETVRSLTTDSRSLNRSPMRFNAGFSMSQSWGKGRRKNRYRLRYNYTDRLSHSDRTSDDGSLRNILSSTGINEHNLDLNLTLYGGPDRNRWGLTGSAGYIDRHYGNSTDYSRYDGEAFVTEPDRRDGMDYRQRVIFASARLMGSLFSRKVGYSAGIHAEHLSNKGTYLNDGGTPLDYSAFNIIPSVSLQFSAGKGNTLGVSYNGSVRRPDANKLNPYVDDSDPENIRTGNPHLKGEYTHLVGANITRQFKVKWATMASLSYNYRTTSNSIAAMTTTDDRNVSTTTYANLSGSRGHSFSANTRLQPFKPLSVSLAVRYDISDYASPWNELNTVRSLSVMASGNLRIVKNTSLHCLYHLMPSTSSVQRRGRTPYSTLEASVSHYFSKIHMGVSLWGNDLLHSSRQVKEAIGNDIFTQHTFRQRPGRNVNISVYWRLGKFNKPESLSAKSYDMGD